MKYGYLTLADISLLKEQDRENLMLLVKVPIGTILEQTNLVQPIDSQKQNNVSWEQAKPFQVNFRVPETFVQEK